MHPRVGRERGERRRRGGPRAGRRETRRTNPRGGRAPDGTTTTRRRSTTTRGSWAECGGARRERARGRERVHGRRARRDVSSGHAAREECGRRPSGGRATPFPIKAAGARHRQIRDATRPRGRRARPISRRRVSISRTKTPRRVGTRDPPPPFTITSSRASGGDAADDEFGRAGRDARHEVRAREGSPSVDQTDAEPTACSPTRRTRLGILHVKTSDDHRAKIPGQWGGERQPSRAGPPDGRATTTRCRGAASHSTVM